MKKYTDEQEILLNKIIEDLWECLFTQIVDNSKILKMNNWTGIEMLMDCLLRLNVTTLVAIIERLRVEDKSTEIMDGLFDKIRKTVSLYIVDAQEV